MTTRDEQDVRYWPTLKGLVVLAAAEQAPPEIGAVEWADAHYPGGYAMNGAGQRIWQPVYGDPDTAHLYPGRGAR